MAKEFDPDDPLEMVGVSADGDLDELGETIVEEFIMMGFSKEELLVMFETPFYQVPHGILKEKGKKYVEALIDTVFERWHANTGNQLKDEIAEDC